MLRFCVLLIAASFMAKQMEVYGQSCKCDPVSDPVLSDPYAFKTVHSPTIGGSALGEPCILGSDCVHSFSFVGKLADGGTNAGWTVVLSTCDMQDGIIKLYDGYPSDLDATEPYETLNNSVCESTRKASKVSSSGNITIVFHSGTNAMNVALFLQVGKAGPAPSTSPSTTTVGTTTKYNGSSDVNPGATQLELAVVIDATETDAKENMRNFASNITGYLDVHTDVSRTSGVRLSLDFVTTSEGGNRGPAWSYLNDGFANEVLGFPTFPGSEPKYLQLLRSTIDEAFTFDSSLPYSPRRNAPRIMLILASKDTKEDITTSAVDQEMVNNDVHPVIINFGSDELVNLKKIFGENRLTVINYKDYTDVNSAVQDVLNKVLLSGDTVCELSQPKTENGVTTIESPNFAGIPSVGKKGRYCNNQKGTLNIPIEKPPVKLTAKYELETEKDYLRIWDDNNMEYALLTGYEVEEAQMCINSKELKIEFTTDSEEVFGGFHIEIEPVNSCS